MPGTRRRSSLYETALIATGAGTALVVYYGLHQLQRRYWRMRGKAKARIPHALLTSRW
jgi:hypothetical protein